MTNQRKRFTRQFKLEAVRAMERGDKSPADLARVDRTPVKRAMRNVGFPCNNIRTHTFSSINKKSAQVWTAFSEFAMDLVSRGTKWMKDLGNFP